MKASRKFKAAISSDLRPRITSTHSVANTLACTAERVKILSGRHPHSATSHPIRKDFATSRALAINLYAAMRVINLRGRRPEEIS